MKEIQSVEVTCLVHATEDEARITSSIARLIGVSERPRRERLEGHFGNEVIRLRYHLLGREAGSAFQRITGGLEAEVRRDLIRGISSAIDEHSALFLRFSKQQLVGGRLAISAGDSVRVRVKLRRYAMGGDAASFYLRQLGRGG